MTFDEKSDDYDKLVDDISETMKESVRHHMISDVEVGSFLSSGIDSSYIVSLAKPNKTYTVGSDDPRYDETKYAKDLASKLGIENISKAITKEEYINIIPKLMYHFDEPVADPAAIALYFVAELASKDVKVVLIAGPSSSGKTTFAHRLGIQLRLNGLKPVTLSVDNYFVERQENPRDESGNYDFECIEAIDTELFNSHILKLLNGEEIDVPTFDFEVGTKRYNGEKMKLNDDQILVIEGIHCLNDKLTPLIPKNQKYKIYISCLTVLNQDYNNRISTTDSRLIRRIVRDYQFRGYSALHTLQMWDSVNRGEQKNIFPFQEQADSMFNSSLIYEIAVLKDYAVPLLEAIDNSNPEYSEAKKLISSSE